MSLREAMLGLVGRHTTVSVNGIGTFNVCEMSLADRDKMESLWQSAGGREKMRAILLVCSLRDEAMKPVFGLDDVDTVAGLPAAVLHPLVEAAMKINGLSDADIEDDSPKA